MSEIGRFISLKVTKLFQESRNLYNDSENILIGRMVVHRKSFDSLIVLDNWIKSFFFQFLPILAQFILVVVVKHEQEVFNVWNCLFELEVTLCCKQVVSQLFQLSDTIFGAFQRKGQCLMIRDNKVWVVGCCYVEGWFHSLKQCLDERCRLNWVYSIVLDDQWVENHLEHVPLAFSHSTNIDDFLWWKSLLGQA